MKKLINSVETVLTESLEGLAAAHSDILTLDPDHRFVRRRHPKSGKVALISGGGSGHEPLHAGLVGHGMLDAACPGQVFTSPTPDQMAAAAEAVAAGDGTVFIVKNYEGDVMNFDMAREMLGGNIETVLTDDDVAVENSLYTTGRRGVAGTLIVEKIAGAAAERGADLAAVARIGRKVNAATFDIDDRQMEMGVGIHGEPGRRRVDVKQADAIAEEMVTAICSDLKDKARGQAILFVNGFGATPLMELYLMYGAARRLLDKRGVKIARSLTGSYVTSLDMAGCSITVTMLDEEMLELWDEPVHTAALRWKM
jgi:phosphoenolpyruvate---glycerone phosphotransferase subunit DhaK